MNGERWPVVGSRHGLVDVMFQRTLSRFLIGAALVGMVGPITDKANAADNRITGIELTSEHGYSLGLAPQNAQLLEVERFDKTAFVAVRMAGEKTVSMCAYVSLWQTEQKFHKKLIKDTNTGPCTTNKMNLLKNRFTFGKNFNCLDCTDGTYYTDTVSRKTCDTRIYRHYYTRNTPENPTNRQGFEDPVIVNGRIARISQWVHYRFESPDGKAARVRLPRTYFKKYVSVEKAEEADLWVWVRNECISQSGRKGGPKRTGKTKRGHRHEIQRHAEKSEKAPVSSAKNIIVGYISLPDERNYKTIKVTQSRKSEEVLV